MTKALVIGASKNGLKNAVMPKYMRFFCGIGMYSDNTEPIPQPIVMLGTTRPPVNP